MEDVDIMTQVELVDINKLELDGLGILGFPLNIWIAYQYINLMKFKTIFFFLKAWICSRIRKVQVYLDFHGNTVSKSMIRLRYE